MTLRIADHHTVPQINEEGEREKEREREREREKGFVLRPLSTRGISDRAAKFKFHLG